MNKRIFTLCLLLQLLAAAALLAQSRPPAKHLAKAVPAAPVRPYLMAQLGHPFAGGDVSVAYSANNSLVLTGHGNVACLWDVATGKEIQQFIGRSSFVRVAFVPNSHFMLTVGEGGTVRLWDAATGKETRQFATHHKGATNAKFAPDTNVAFSPDGRFAVTGCEDKSAVVWDVAAGKEVERFAGHLKNVSSVAYSSDGRFMLTGCLDNRAYLWDAATGKKLRQFAGHTAPIRSVAFSPSGQFILTGSDDSTARLWNMTTGQQVKQFGKRKKVAKCSIDYRDRVTDVAFSFGNHSVLTISEDEIVHLWNATTGKETRQFFMSHQGVTNVAFSPDKRFVLIGGGDKTAILWDVVTGKEAKQFVGHSSTITSVSFSADARFLLTGSYDKSAHLWDMATGKQMQQFTGHSAGLTNVVFSLSGKYVLTSSWDKTARLWDATTSQEIRQFVGHSDAVSSIAFSPDEHLVLTGSLDNTARLWETTTGKEIREFIGHDSVIESVAFSPDGRFALTGSFDGTARLWDVTNGKEIQQFAVRSKENEVESIAFSPDGQFAAIGDRAGIVHLWNVTTGNEERKFTGHSSGVESLVFSPDGRFLLTGSDDTTARLWDATTGKEIRQFAGHFGDVWGVAFSPNGKYVITGGWDSVTRLWETETGKELCRLISFDDGSWAVVDAAGRYDASNPDKMDGLCWVVGNEPVNLSQLKARYYDPGLLAKIMGFNKEPLRPVEAFNHIKFYPNVTLKAPAAGSAKMSIALANRGGGIGAVQVWVNGKEFKADARGPKPDVNAPSALLTLDLSHAPGLRPGQTNTIRVTARNGEGYLESRGVEIAWDAPGKAENAVKPELYAIVAGIGDYGSANLHLNLPSRDAAQMAAALTLGAKRLFGADKVHLTLLSSDSGIPGAIPPTKANFRKAFEAVRKQTRPDDILVVYLAGHGVAISDSYCYLTAEARSFDLSDPDVRKTRSLSDSELSDWTTAIPALKQVMILDTCAAGSAARKLAETRDISRDQKRAIDRLKDRTGFYVLMGCASDAVSYEASQYGQGLLTYALLSGMQGEKLRDGQYVDVQTLFQYAADKVPTLAEGIGGIQKPQIMTPTAHNAPKDKQQASFDIGQLSPADKQAIVLPQPRPRVLRPALLNIARARDDLDLSAALRKVLRERSEGAGRGEHSPVYLDIEPEDLPDAIVPSGLYTVAGDTVTVNLVLNRSGKESKITVTGSAKDIPALAEKLAAAIADSIAGK